MLSFLQKLSELEKNKKQVVRVLHYGDSMLWSDMITSGIKEKFQKDFGDGGRGLVPITNQPSRKVLLHKNLTDETAFTWKNLDHRQFVNPQIGFLGEAAIPNYPRVTMKHEMDGTKVGWTKAELFYRSSQAGSPLTVKANYQTIKDEVLQPLDETRITQTNADICNRIHFKLEDSSLLQLEISPIFPSQTVFDAMNFETDSGLAYSTVSRQGIEVGDLLLIEEKSLACGFTHYKPDLVVFQFGVNESENLARKAYITPESYRQNLEDVIVRFKKILPEANLLLLSPIERISRNEKRRNANNAGNSLDTRYPKRSSREI
ncbi:MAG: hypothetical protein IPQ05_12760 [Leptospiraceae bacterium]|nr:hypothetical protein [Leptospiraceae bacterium]